MKNVCTILCSAVGGAVLGSALTLFLAPKSGEEMRKDLQSMVLEQIESLQSQISKCSCMMSDDCVDEQGNK